MCRERPYIQLRQKTASTICPKALVFCVFLCLSVCFCLTCASLLEASEWKNIPFTVRSKGNDSRLAVFLGRIGDADETYLNGVKISGEGKLGERFVTAAEVERLYLLPPQLLKPEGENLLSVKVMNLYPESPLEIPAVIGDYGSLLDGKLRGQDVAMRVDFILFTFIFIWIEFCIFLYAKGVTSREYIAFGIFMLLYGTSYFLNSLTFYETGLKTFFIQKLILSLFAALPAAMLYFMTCVFDEKPKAVMRYSIIFSLVLSAAAFFIRGEEACKIFIYLFYVKKASLFFSRTVCCTYVYQARSPNPIFYKQTAFINEDAA